jgi:hypothetical protein
MLMPIALASVLTLGCNKNKGADSPEDAGDGPMEKAGESVDESANETEEAFDEAGEDMEDAVDEAGDEVDGDPTTE